MTTSAPIGSVPRSQQIRAIIAREIGSRFTGDPLGYGWAYLTPLAWIAVIYGVFHILGRSSPIDADVGSFILSGIMPYLAFRYQVSSVLRSKSAYRHVMALPTVTPEAVYLAIIALEFYNCLIIYLVLLSANFLLFGEFHMADPLRVLLGFALASGAGGALGFAIASIGGGASSLQRAAAVALRPMFYLSAVFYTANELPQSWLTWLSWNPLLHAIEFMRSGSFVAYESHVANGWVPVAFIIVCVVLGRALSSPAGPAGETASPLE